MICPACDMDMFVLEFEEIEIDYCLGCRGVWLDSGELELIGERAGVLQRDLLTALNQGEGAAPAGRKLRCPVCAKGLQCIEAPTTPPIELDRCPRGHGLWFDHGELAGVVQAAGADENNLLARFFHDLERTEV